MKLLKWDIADKVNSYSVAFGKTQHFISRCCQRNFSEYQIKTVIDYGTPYFKQGFIYYVLGKSDFPTKTLAQDRKMLRNLIVVVSSRDAAIITAYRSSNPHKHIRMKSKRLHKFAA